MVYYAGTSGLGEQPVTHNSGLITIIESLENPVQIGVATNTNKPGDMRVLYTLYVHGKLLPGSWLLDDGKFKPADDGV
jgi:hypothetical protein